MNYVYMVSNLLSHNYDDPNPLPTLWVAAADLFRHPIAAVAYQDCWQRCFKSWHKHFTVVRTADYIVTAVKTPRPFVHGRGHLDSVTAEEYLGFAAATPVSYEEYEIHEVMRYPDRSEPGIVGSIIMNAILGELKNRHVHWARLSCDPGGRRGTLVQFYERFGFKVVA